jgi:uracil-DNA glycosylase family 4
MSQLQKLQRKITRCKRCPRLVAWREEVARTKVFRFDDWTYWGKPVPGFGDPNAQLLIVGLAPAAHGANRTGRMFTGDRSGEWLYRTLHKFGFASQPDSVSRDDRLQLAYCYITAAVRCAPPKNKPLPIEMQNCRPFLLDELQLLKNVKVIVALGKIASDTIYEAFRSLEWTVLQRKPLFGHGKEYQLNDHQILLCSFHPSQQNTFTGRLTQKMFEGIFRRAQKLLQQENI